MVVVVVSVYVVYTGQALCACILLFVLENHNNKKFFPKTLSITVSIRGAV